MQRVITFLALWLLLSLSLDALTGLPPGLNDAGLSAPGLLAVVALVGVMTISSMRGRVPMVRWKQLDPSSLRVLATDALVIGVAKTLAAVAVMLLVSLGASSALGGGVAGVAAPLLAALALAALDLLGRREEPAPGPRPGQVWWTQIPFEDGTGAKDRPALVIRARGDRYDVLAFTSQDKSTRRGYLPVQVPSPSRTTGKAVGWLRTDRVVTRRRDDFRRYAWDLDLTTRRAVSAQHSVVLDPS